MSSSTQVEHLFITIIGPFGSDSLSALWKSFFGQYLFIRAQIKTAYKFIKRERQRHSPAWLPARLPAPQMESIYFMLSFKSCFTSAPGDTCCANSPEIRLQTPPHAPTPRPAIYSVRQPDAAAFATMFVPLTHTRTHTEGVCSDWGSGGCTVTGNDMKLALVVAACLPFPAPGGILGQLVLRLSVLIYELVALLLARTVACNSAACPQWFTKCRGVVERGPCLGLRGCYAMQPPKIVWCTQAEHAQLQRQQLTKLFYSYAFLLRFSICSQKCWKTR